MEKEYIYRKNVENKYEIYRKLYQCLQVIMNINENTVNII